MAIGFPSNIRLNNPIPLDERQVVENSAERLALKYIYEGLQVFEKDTKKIYVAYKTGSDDEAVTFQWKEVQTGEATGSPILRGYYFNNNFYTDTTYTKELAKDENKIYVNIPNGALYTYSVDSGFIAATKEATDQIMGIMKLYSVHGQNIDGTMTQKGITDGIDAIEFGVDDSDSECLVLEKPW